ncbi:transposase [uncultured Methylobacterium sp.]|uniref:transposase n=1 Tax=uncultured Methylobacterium sp. TaxID=157278 RepID=UPI0035CC30B4
MDAAGPEAPLSFVDGCHPSCAGRPAHGWIKRGATVELKFDHGRTRITINGALSWPDRTLIHREEIITSAAMIRLFADLEARHPEAAEIAVVLDNARYNRSREIEAWLDRPGRRLKLIYLPPCAPKLHLIERFWHVMKRKVLFNKAYAKFALFKQAFDAFFERLNEHEADLASLITDRFHLIGQPDAGIPSA